MKRQGNKNKEEERHGLSHAYERRHVDIHTIVGTTGTDKTRYVTDYVTRKYGTMKKLYILSMRNGTVWWDGYCGQPVVLFDDFSSHWRNAIPAASLLRYIDSYPVEVPLMGYRMPLMASEIFITSNEHPSMWYASSRGENQTALRTLMRRLEPGLELIEE